MANYKKPFMASALLLALGYVVVMYALADMMTANHILTQFKHICTHNTVMGYAIFSAALCIVLFSGFPAATIIMLLAGMIFSFWEAMLLITSCRLGVAISSFSIGQHFANNDGDAKKPRLLQKLEDHPKTALLLMRLAPLPDSMVNYTMLAAPVKAREYALVSLIGMVPFTLFMIYMGESLGSIKSLIQYVT